MTALLVYTSFRQELLSWWWRRNITAGSSPLLPCHWLSLYEVQECYKSYLNILKIFPQTASEHCLICISFLNESPHWFQAIRVVQSWSKYSQLHYWQLFFTVNPSTWNKGKMERAQQTTDLPCRPEGARSTGELNLTCSLTSSTVNMTYSVRSCFLWGRVLGVTDGTKNSTSR